MLETDIKSKSNVKLEYGPIKITVFIDLLVQILL